MGRNFTLPKHIVDLPAYTPIEPFEVLSARVGRSPDQITKLDANENPYGMSPRAVEALAKLPFGHIYPDPESRALREKISPMIDAPAANILAGSGADELIDLIMRLTLNPGDVVLNCPPTFGMYQFDGDLNAAKVVNIPRQDDFSLDMPAIRQAIETQKPKLLFLTSPNNPNGSLIDRANIEELMGYDLLLILDEAYIEFADPRGLGKTKSLAGRAAAGENLIVLRTFSKLAGLAGLRVGYGVFPNWLMPVLWKAKQPYNVNVAASTAAIAAIEDQTYLRDVVTKLVSERERLFAALSANKDLRVYPSSANFILIRVLNGRAAEIKQRLASEHGVFIRYFNKPGLDDCVRVSVGKPEQNDLFLEVFNALVNEGS